MLLKVFTSVIDTITNIINRCSVEDIVQVLDAITRLMDSIHLKMEHKTSNCKGHREEVDNHDHSGT